MAKRCQPSQRPRISTFAEQVSLSTFYKLGDTVGAGGFGKVKLAVHTLTGETVAIKIMDKKALGDEFMRAEQEINLLKDMRHPRICELYQVINTPDKLYLVMEHCSNGELFDFLIEKERLGENDARIFFRQIVSAVAYLHNHGCSHRDLKPENILLDEKQNVRLIDFGLAARPKGGMNSFLDTCCGSPAYVAPELIAGIQYLGGQADIWSLGIMLYALVTGVLPFNDDDVNKLFRKIQKGDFTLPQYLSESLKNLLKSMLQVDPARRLTMNALVSHRWIMGSYGCGVKWDFKQDNSLDRGILDIMSVVAPSRVEEMAGSVRNRSYDYWHATYLILKSRERQGKMVRIDASSLPLHNPAQFSSPAFRSHVALSPIKNHSPDDCIQMLDTSFDRYDDSDSDTSMSVTSMSVTSSANPSAESVMETARPLREPNREFRSPQPPKHPSPPSGKDSTLRLTPSKSCDVDLDRQSGWNQPGSHRRDIREKSKSLDDNLENQGLVTPTKAAKRMGENRLTVRKMFGSIEKGFGRVKEALTPRASLGGRGQLRELKGNAITNNVTMVNSTDAQAVLESIKNALTELDYEWKMKRPFIIRAKKMGKQGVLKLSLEVCWISHRAGTCGIRRKRIQGEGFEYKKMYAALYSKILTLANTDPSAKMCMTPTRLAFDC